MKNHVENPVGNPVESTVMPGRNGGWLRRGGANGGAGGRPRRDVAEIARQLTEMRDTAAALQAIASEVLEALLVSPWAPQLGAIVRSERRARSQPRPVETPVSASETLTKVESTAGNSRNQYARAREEQSNANENAGAVAAGIAALAPQRTGDSRRAADFRRPRNP